MRNKYVISVTSVPLQHLFDAGIDGKCWRLVKSWYTMTTSSVRINGHLSEPFVVERGVRQGSVLSPLLFSLVMNPLLKEMQGSGLRLSINGLPVGSNAHADDIRAITNSWDNLEALIQMVQRYTTRNGLKLNVEKCEILTAPKSTSSQNVVRVGESSIPVRGSIKVLGTWLTSNLTSDIAVDDNIQKARRAFFALGSTGLFLNPLTVRDLCETCVFPVLLFGCENWILNNQLVEKLESFQSQLGKRILRLSKTTTNMTPLIALRWPSVRARVVCRKLGFLQRAIKNESGLISEVLRAIAADDIKTSLAVKQCSELEKPFQTSHTDHTITAGLMGEEVGDPSRDIMVKDWYVTIPQAEKHPSITHLTTFARQSSWMKVWDYALDRGSSGTNRALAVLKLVSAPVYGDRRCMLSRCQSPVESTDTMIDHFIKEHQEITLFSDADKLLSEICLSPDSLFNLGQSLLSAMQPDF